MSDSDRTAPIARNADRGMSAPAVAAESTFARESAAAGPWNPGIESIIPNSLRPLCTFLQPGNVVTTVAQAAGRRDLTGLSWVDVVAFRPQRLALHELLVRVTARVSVPDGSKIEDLGINFREITRRILARHVEPRMDEIESVWNATRSRLRDCVHRELEAALSVAGGSSEAPLRVARRERSLSGRRASLLDGRRGWLRELLTRLFGGRDSQHSRHTRPDRSVTAPGAEYADLTRSVARWETRARASELGVERAASRALAKVVSAVLVRHGAI